MMLMRPAKDAQELMAASRRQFCRQLCAGIVAAHWCDFALSATGPFVVVTEFGAKGDGIHDDRPAIMQAIQAASQQRSGQVFLPRGTYQLQHVSGGELIGLEGIRGL